MTPAVLATVPPSGELEALVAWAMRAARAQARLSGLPVDDLVGAALHAVRGALDTFQAGRGELGAHVRRRVRGELLDAARIARDRREREPLLDDLEDGLPVGAEDDEAALGRVSGVEAWLIGSPEESLLVRERQAALDREVQRLPREDRRLHELRFRRGAGWEEVAGALGISVRAAQYRSAQIRERLTAALRAYRDEG